MEKSCSKAMLNNACGQVEDAKNLRLVSKIYFHV